MFIDMLAPETVITERISKVSGFGCEPDPVQLKHQSFDANKWRRKFVALAHADGSAGTIWRRLDAALGTYVWVLLLPVLLVGVGVWERGRAADKLDVYGVTAEALPEVLADLRRVAATDPMTMVEQIEGSERRSVPATVAVAEAEAMLPGVERGAMLARILRPLADTVVAAGLATLLAAIVGMAIAFQAGVAARRSRVQLVASFARVHRFLPFTLGVLVLGLAISVVGIAAFELIGMWFWERVSGGEMKLAVFGVILAGMAVYGAYSALRGMRDIFALATPDPIHEAGRVVGAAEAPGLWRLVHEVAAREQAIAPDTIVIGMDGGFYVTESEVTLTPGEQTLHGRTLFIPAPYLELLDEEELVGIIGHELAHFVGEDTAYTRHFMPIYTGLGRALDAMGAANADGFAMHPAFRLGYYAIERFDHAVKHWSRLREFEADRISAAANGPKAIARSLVRTTVIGPVVTDALFNVFEDPESATDDLVSVIVDTVREKGWPEYAEHSEDRTPHPTDTHPSTPQRIEALNLRLDAELIAAATRPVADPATSPGYTLFADWLATRRTLTADFVAIAQKAGAVHREYLEGLVAAVSDEAVEVRESFVSLMAVLGVIAIGFAAGAVAVFLNRDTPFFASDPSGVIIAIVLLGAIAVASAWYVLSLNRLRNDPAFVLTPDTIKVRRLDRPLRWLDVAIYQSGDGGTKIETVFALADGVELPKKLRFSPRTKVEKKNRVVRVFSYGFQGMTAPAFFDLLDSYAAAARAREDLAAKQSRVRNTLA